jgi:hypothetical protein
MASATFNDLSSRSIKSASTLNYPKSTINQTNYPFVGADTILPWRIQFTNIQIRGYDRNITPPIGIAVIGINNYIL